MLNFSIAYGKTAHGLSKDWKTSLKEAEETVERWYADRPEVRGKGAGAGRQSGVGWVGMGQSGCVGRQVWAGSVVRQVRACRTGIAGHRRSAGAPGWLQVKKWQKEQREKAVNKGYVTTILGRQRQLPDAKHGSKAAQGHALRAAINTPIQGSAADIATAAMLRIDADEALRDMGWRLLLQVGVLVVWVEGLLEVLGASCVGAAAWCVGAGVLEQAGLAQAGLQAGCFADQFSHSSTLCRRCTMRSSWRAPRKRRSRCVLHMANACRQAQPAEHNLHPTPPSAPPTAWPCCPASSSPCLRRASVWWRACAAPSRASAPSRCWLTWWWTPSMQTPGTRQSRAPMRAAWTTNQHS